MTPLIYAAAFAGALASAWVATPLMIRLAYRVGALDRPSEIKAQSVPIPHLGGAAIVVAFVLVVLAANLIVQPVSGLGELGAILALGLVLSLMGLIDDLRGLSPFLRLGVEIGAAVGLVLAGAGVSVFASGVLNGLLTVVWVVGIVNAFNLLDNMDGLSAGTATIAALSFFVLAAANGQFLVGSLAIALAGCALGFLRHNFHPATVYMGDAGSLFLGFMLAVVGMKLRFEGPTQVTFLVPILVCGLAIFDTTLVTIERLRHGRSPLSGGRDHTSHRLVAFGLRVPWAVGLIYAVAAGLGWAAFVVARIDRVSAWLLTGLIVTMACVFGKILTLVEVYASPPPSTSEEPVAIVRTSKDLTAGRG